MEEKVKVRIESSKTVKEFEGNAAYVSVFNEANDAINGIITGSINHPVYDVGVLEGMLDNIRDRVNDKTISILHGIKALSAMTTYLAERKEEILRGWAKSMANDPSFNIKDFMEELSSDLNSRGTDDTEAEPDVTDFSS